MKKKRDKKVDDVPGDWEPPWMNPENDRKTPYTEEELEEFAEGFISNTSDIPEVRTCKKITDAFDGPIAPHLRLLLNRQILTVVHYSSGLTQSSQTNLRHT